VEPPMREPSGLWLPRLPTLSFRFKMECGGSGDDLDVAPEVAADPSSWIREKIGCGGNNGQRLRPKYLHM
jgi:hypothetical protein